MGLRDLAQSHLSAILADANGPGESVTYMPVSGSAVTISGVWSDHASDARHPIGLGLESTVSGARLRLSMDDVPQIDPAASIVRNATGERWTIDQINISAAVAWMLDLSRPTSSDVRSLR